VIPITKELLEKWGFFGLIPDEQLPMGVMGVFNASISSRDKVELLLHKEILGQRGLVYVAAKAARRACTKTELSHSDSLRALDLCDRYVEGEAVSEEELARAVNAANEAARAIAEAASTWAAFDASVSDDTRDVWAARAAVFAAGAALGTWTVSDAWDATTWAWDTTGGVSDEERNSQLIVEIGF